MKIIQIKCKNLALLLMVGMSIISCSSNDDNGVPENRAPGMFNLLEVADGASAVSLKPTFKWSQSTDPDGDIVNYDLYLGTSNPPISIVASGLNQTNFVLDENLETNTKYYWMVLAKDGKNGETPSKLNSFKTIGGNRELIIGKWHYDRIQGDPPLNDCAKQSFYHFKESRESFSEFYVEKSNGDCDLMFSFIETYELISENILRINGNNSYFINFEILFISESQLTLKSESDGSIVHYIKN